MGKSCQLSALEQQKIQQWTAAHGTPQQVALRCRIVLAAAAGESNVAIAERLSVNRNTVILWRKRFSDEGLDCLWDIAPGRGRKPLYQMDKITAIVDATLHTKPAGMTHWSCRSMAQSQGVSKSTVNNIWRAHNLQPHRTETFNPHFSQRARNTTGYHGEVVRREELAHPPADNSSLTQRSGQEVLRRSAKLFSARQLSYEERLLRMPL